MWPNARPRSYVLAREIFDSERRRFGVQVSRRHVGSATVRLRTYGGRVQWLLEEDVAGLQRIILEWVWVHVHLEIPQTLVL